MIGPFGLPGICRAPPAGLRALYGVALAVAMTAVAPSWAGELGERPGLGEPPAFGAGLPTPPAMGGEMSGDGTDVPSEAWLGPQDGRNLMETGHNVTWPGQEAGQNFLEAGDSQLAPGWAAHHPGRFESWLKRPASAGWFVGSVHGSPLMDDWVGQGSGPFGGCSLGWEWNPFWGCQTRLATAWTTLHDSQRAKDAQEAADDDLGLEPDDPFRDRFDHRRVADLVLWDIGVVHYPWGDRPWRPYVAAGLGAARVDFLDRLSVRRAETVFALPVAVGVKYQLSHRLSFRSEVADNILFGSPGGFDTLHDVSVTAGLEYRFGGRRRAYWPWNPGRHYW